MKALARHERALAVGLAGVAGFVDSLGFLQLGGLFVSFMSGNSTRLAVGLAQGEWRTAATAFVILVLFVLGAMLGALLVRDQGVHARSRVLGAEAVLLAAAAIAGQIGQGWIAVGLMVLAMGIENAIFLREGEVRVGLTYMTGALVKLGHSLASAMRGEDRLAFMPHLMLWGGLFAGAMLGALAWQVIGLNALWIAAGLAACMFLLTRMRAV